MEDVKGNLAPKEPKGLCGGSRDQYEGCRDVTSGVGCAGFAKVRLLPALHLKLSEILCGVLKILGYSWLQIMLRRHLFRGPILGTTHMTSK